MASPMPVLPLVASITVCPGLSSPLRSAASITPSARRSFTEPSGLNASSFTNSSTPGGASLATLTTGVRPTVSRMFSNRLPTVILFKLVLMLQDNYASASPDRAERRQGPLHHGVGRRQADAQIRGRVHDRAGQHEHLAVGQHGPMPLGIAGGPLAPEIERPLRRQDLKARRGQRGGQPVAPARKRRLIDRQMLQVLDCILHDGVWKTPA